MIAFFEDENGVDFFIEIDHIFYGQLIPAMTDDVYIFAPAKSVTYSSDELRQIANKLDELNKQGNHHGL